MDEGNADPPAHVLENVENANEGPRTGIRFPNMTWRRVCECIFLIISIYLCYLDTNHGPIFVYPDPDPEKARQFAIIDGMLLGAIMVYWFVFWVRKAVKIALATPAELEDSEIDQDNVATLHMIFECVIIVPVMIAHAKGNHVPLCTAFTIGLVANLFHMLQTA